MNARPRTVESCTPVPKNDPTVRFEPAGFRRLPVEPRAWRRWFRLRSSTCSTPTASRWHPFRARPPRCLDWARELANQLIGRIKNRLLPFGVRLEIGLLSLQEPNLLRHQLQASPGLRTYVGRTLRGPVLATAQGLPEDSTLAYVGAASAAEGGMMLWL